ncbi:MAG: YidC/Oxa1 family membrane protein insertase [Patescibacteria group bacterium]|nr:YidC/Oxa1 family membrane protein insertase [Patescibacteria group bacterium]
MFNTYLYIPLLNILIFLYNNFSFGSLGLAIILLTVLIRVILFPLFYKSAKSQMIMQKIQPLIQKIQKDHKEDKEKQAQALMDLYKKYKVNPFSSILMLFVQIPVLIALYSLFRSDFSAMNFSVLYSFVSAPQHINTLFLGLIDLKSSSIIMVVLAAIAQYFQGALTLPKKEKGKEVSAAEKMTRQMIYYTPLFTVLVLWKMPSAIGLYWLVTSLFSVGQQIYINKKVKVNINE